MEEKLYVDSIGDYLADSFEKIVGFDYRWSSLISSEPLLFEDIDYLRIRSFIKQECTEKEIQAYKEGKLRNIYATIESLLVCNLEYYDRIISFCTMVFLHYVRISENEVVSNGLNKLPFVFEMTPTQIACCTLTSSSSTEWELNYAWKWRKPIIHVHSDNLLRDNFAHIYKNQFFAKFSEYRSYIRGSNGYQATLLIDKTPNKTLARVCSKFTKTSSAVGEQQLETIMDYISEDQKHSNQLYESLKTELKKIYHIENESAIYCFVNEFFIFTKKFKMRICKDETGKIQKQYLSNNYECFIAEAYLAPTIKEQINWARHTFSDNFNIDKHVLKSLLTNMLLEDYKQIKCIRKMPDYKVFSEVTFKGSFNNVYAIEKFWFNDEVIHENQKCFSKPNMANYLVERGYYIFGTIVDVDILCSKDITRNRIIKHYSNYCVPVLQHMSSVQMLYLQNNNEIIDVLMTGVVPENKISNNKLYVRTKKKPIKKQIMQTVKQIVSKNKNINQTKKLSYWRAIS